MLRYILLRLLYTIPIALGVTVFVFALIHLSGDPLNAVVAPDATAETVEKLRGLRDTAPEALELPPDDPLELERHLTPIPMLRG